MDKETYIAEEAFIVLHSGEIPEIALYSSLYYLAEDPEGPCLALNAGDIFPLVQAVARRYRAIILRDLEPGNRDKRSYRGLARCAVNWQRLLKFCTREGLDFSAIRAETAEALQNFLVQEVADVGSRKRASSINCSQAEIDGLAKSVGLAPADLPDGWQKLCPADA